MRKTILFFCFLAMFQGLFAQGKVSTRKYRLADFQDKVTKVVLSGNELLDSALQQEVVSVWTASAFEFCTPGEFETLRTNPQYYFLLTAESRFKGESQPGILFLTLVKGDAAAAQGIAAMPEIVSLPLAAAPGGSARELIYLGALVQAVQEYTLAAMESEKTAYDMEGWFNANYAKWGKMKRICVAREDIAAPDTALERYLDSDFHVVEEAEADAKYQEGDFNTLVGYTVSPVFPEIGASYCYKMLFEADTHTLYYIRRHKISAKNGAGFLKEDLKRIARKR